MTRSLESQGGTMKYMFMIYAGEGGRRPRAQMAAYGAIPPRR